MQLGSPLINGAGDSARPITTNSSADGRVVTFGDDSRTIEADGATDANGGDNSRGGGTLMIDGTSKRKQGAGTWRRGLCQ